MNTTTTINTCSQDILQRLMLCLPKLGPQLRAELPLASLGLDSMDTVELLCVIHEEFGVSLTEAEFQPHHRLADVLAIIASKERRDLQKFVPEAA